MIKLKPRQTAVTGLRGGGGVSRSSGPPEGSYQIINTYIFTTANQVTKSAFKLNCPSIIIIIIIIIMIIINLSGTL